MNPNEWILSDDTGVSSKTIWAVMMGLNSRDPDIPHDPADFGRCYRLLKNFPEWRERLSEVAAYHPKWGPMVERWDEMTELYEEEIQNPDGRAPKLYELMKSIHDDCMVAGGWVKTGPYSWSREPQDVAGAE